MADEARLEPAADVGPINQDIFGFFHSFLIGDELNRSDAVTWFKCSRFGAEGVKAENIASNRCSENIAKIGVWYDTEPYALT